MSVKGSSFALPGKDGAAATVIVGSVSTLAVGAIPTVTNAGTAAAAKFNFGFPAPAPGKDGVQPTLATGTVTTLASGAQATASISGSSPNYLVNIGIPAGVQGNPGATPVFTIGTVTSGTAAASIAGTVANPILNLVIPAGTPGSNASATPLGTASPKALGTAAAGTATAASHEDHVHPLPTGLLTLLTTATVGETLVLGLSLGVKRYAVTVAGAAVSDKIMLALTGAPQNGTLQDAYVSVAGTVSVGLLLPALGIGSVISVPLAIFKVS